MNIFLIILALVALGAVLYAYSAGFFRKTKVGAATIDSYKMVYKKYRGSYSGLRDLMEEIHNFLKAAGISESSMFNVCFNKNQIHDFFTDDLQAIAGCLVDKEDWEKIPSEPYVQRETVRAQAYIVDFPDRGDFSAELSMKKAYPVLQSYIDGLGLEDAPIMQVYDDSEGEIKYIAFLEPNLQYAKIITELNS